MRYNSSEGASFLSTKDNLNDPTNLNRQLSVIELGRIVLPKSLDMSRLLGLSIFL